MRINRFYLDQDLTTQDLKVVDCELLNQWRNVLRLKTGDVVSIFNASGGEVKYQLKDLSKTEATFQPIEQVVCVWQPKREITLYLSVLKKENFELVVQKATELGATKIVPIVCERTIKFGLNQDRLNKIAREASEQCGRNTIPKICDLVEFKKVLCDSGAEQMNILFDQTGVAIGSVGNRSLGAFIGPEGGWSEDELSLAKEKGVLISRLGELTLRAETAGIVAVYELGRI